MGKGVGKLLFLLAVLGFGIFYGVSISKEGIEQIHGPIEPADGDFTARTEQMPNRPEATTEDDDKDARSAAAPPIQPVRPASHSPLSWLFDKLGSLLHLFADHLIRFLVGVGEAVLS